MSSTTTRRVLPGFGLSLGFTLAYLSLIVLIPLATVFINTATLSFGQFWDIVSTPRVVATYRLSFGASLLAAAINVVFGVLLAWVLVRYTFPGKKLIDALIPCGGIRIEDDVVVTANGVEDLTRPFVPGHRDS